MCFASNLLCQSLQTMSLNTFSSHCIILKVETDGIVRPPLFMNDLHAADQIYFYAVVQVNIGCKTGSRSGACNQYCLKCLQDLSLTGFHNTLHSFQHLILIY